MQIVPRRLVEEPDIALFAGATPVVIGALFPAVQDRFVLTLVIGAPERERVLRPDDEGGPLCLIPLTQVALDVVVVRSAA